MRLLRHSTLLFLIFFPVASSAGFEIVSGGGPSNLANQFQQSLVRVMKQAKSLGVEGRYKTLLPIINSTFNLKLMAASVTFPYWRTGSNNQKLQLVNAFKEMSVATLATLFDNYNGEIFIILRERKIRHRIVVVDAEIKKADEGVVKISYVTAFYDGRWWIIDIIVEGGISEIKKRKNEFIRTLREGGLTKLTILLHKRALDLVPNIVK